MPDVAQPKRVTSFNPAHLAILERYGGKRGKQILALVAAGQLALPLAKFLYERWTDRDDFTITVPGIDDVYPDLHDWVLDRIPESERKAMIATTVFADRDEDQEEVSLRYDGSRSQSVTIDGHKVMVEVKRENVPERVSLPENWRQYMENITFTTTTAEGRDAVVGMIRGLLDKKQQQERQPALFMPSRWGGDWTRRGDLPARTLESTILKDGQLERLRLDLSRFLASEDEYTRLSQPWHRGYLFHGQPGTGKTSVARALANYFDLPTYYLPLGDIDKDTNLIQFVAAIQPQSVLLLEDVDNFDAATERRDDQDRVTVAALLNALDGVWTPHGLITIMTTNNKKALDPALIRAGRIDREEEFTNLDAGQALEIVSYFNGCTDSTCAGVDAASFVDRSPAELIEELLRRREMSNGTPDRQDLHAVVG